MINKLVSAFTLVVMTSGPALAGERGSGYYAANCKDSGGGYAITINKDGTASVDRDPKSYENVLTSYSFFGKDTPSDFVIAIMFDEKNSPLPAYKGQSGWIEIWDNGKSLYALENGRASKKLKLCAKN